MSTSDRSFEQVKNILGKLDRNIDAARARRLHTNTPSVPVPVRAAVAAAGIGQSSVPVNASSNGALIGAPSGSHGLPSPNTAPKPPMPSKSGFGRARPLRPNGGDSAGNS